jgi:hypothetical protein
MKFALIIVFLKSAVLAQKFYDPNEIQDCITYISSYQEVSVQEFDVFYETEYYNVLDPVKYNWRYELYFFKAGVKCKLQGEELKVYIHGDHGGLVITGILYRNWYWGNDRVKWFTEPAPGKQKVDSRFPIPKCDTYIYNANPTFRAKAGRLYQYGANDFCKLDVQIESMPCVDMTSF